MYSADLKRWGGVGYCSLRKNFRPPPNRDLFWSQGRHNTSLDPIFCEELIFHGFRDVRARFVDEILSLLRAHRNLRMQTQNSHSFDTEHYQSLDFASFRCNHWNHCLFVTLRSAWHCYKCNVYPQRNVFFCAKISLTECYCYKILNWDPLFEFQNLVVKNARFHH